MAARRDERSQANPTRHSPTASASCIAPIAPLLAASIAILIVVFNSTPTRAASGEPHAAPRAANAPAPAADTANRPLYYERPIAIEDLEGRSLRELSLMRNWIFARAGNPFRKSWLRDYFGVQPWYQRKEALDRSLLSPVDLANAEAITRYELSIPRDELVRRHAEITRRADLDAVEAIERLLLSEHLGELRNSPAGGPATPLEDPSLLDRQLTLAQLDDFSRRDLRLLRNLVYARKGRVFDSGFLALYFARFSWYAPDSSYSDARLGTIDRRNIKLIRSLEDELGGPLGEGDDDWFFQA